MSVNYNPMGTNPGFASVYDNTNDQKRIEREQKFNRMKEKSVQKVEDYEHPKGFFKRR